MTESQEDFAPRVPSNLQIIAPILLLILMLAGSVYLFGDSASFGANQIVLTLVAAIVALIGVKNGMNWKQLEKIIVSSISISMMAILILLSVGALIGSWILSGTVPTMIYYGTLLLSPSIFYATSSLICAVVSLCVGSSWTTAGTVGVAIMGISVSLGMSPEVTAGAIISGAYFGDKMSPLSDTTNLAPAVAGSDLFSHIKHMTWTTAPSIVISLILFSILSWSHSKTAPELAPMEMLDSLESTFTIGPVMLIPLFVVLFMAYKRLPALPSILAGSLVGIIFAVSFQADAVIAFAGDASLSVGAALAKGTWTVLADGYTSTTGMEQVDNLLSRGGMSSMLTTIWLIITAMVFGGLMYHVGILPKLVQAIMKGSQSRGNLIAKTVATCFGANILTAEQYIAIVMPGRMYREEYQRQNLAPKTLSRVLEDSGTITSVLVPWSTCGAFMAGTLGIATLAYLPYCFFNLINPLISIIYGYLGIAMPKADEIDTNEKLAVPEVR